MSTAKMAELLEKTEKWDPLTTQLIEGVFKNDSRAMESLGERINYAPLAEHARYNQRNPEEGIANASKATAFGFLGAGLGNLMGSAGAYQAAVPAMNSQQAAMLAQQTGEFGGYGLGKTMQAASGAQGMNPMLSAFSDKAGGLLGNSGAKRYAFNQGMDMMQPQQPMQAPPPPQRQPPPQPLMSPYLTEEQKRKLMAQGYSIY